MSKRQIGRREFVRSGSMLVAAAAAGNVVGAENPEQTFDPKKILNYNSKMRYRRLGKPFIVMTPTGTLTKHFENDGEEIWTPR